MKKNNFYPLLFILSLTFWSHNLFATTITVTNGGDAGAGTLRQAITDASDGDIIDFLGVSTVSLTSAQLTVDKSLTIDGGVGKVTITRASGTFRIFQFSVNSSKNVFLKNLKITNGNKSDQAGGILNGVNLTMENCEVSGNSSIQAGGIQNDEVLTMTNCLIINNLYDGGLVTNGTSFSATNCVFSGNQGFGIKAGNSNTVVTLTNCIVSKNINNSSSGSRPGYGMTFSAASGSKITNCTFVSNADNGIRLNTSASNVAIVNSIFSENGASNISYSGSGLGSNSTNNFVGTTASGGLVNGVNGNIVNDGSIDLFNFSDPNGADNIWLTADDGLRLNPTSSAVNSGTNTGILATDILGNTRPYNSGTADMGAYEYSQDLPLPTFTLQPVSTSFCEGATGQLSVTTNSYGISHKWQFNSGASWADVPSGGIYTGETTATLGISDVTGLDTYKFRCLAYNSDNSSAMSNEAILTVDAPMTLMYAGVSNYYLVGDPISPLNPVLGGGSPSSNFTVSPALVTGISINPSTGIISGTPTTTSPSTAYTVSVSNGCGAATDILTFSTLNSPPPPTPVISSQPQDINVCPSSSGSATIVASDVEIYLWQVNDGGGWVDVPSSSPYSGEDEATLVISNSSGLNGYMYRCKVSNGSGIVTSNEISLNEGKNVVVTNGNNAGAGSLRAAMDCISTGDTITFSGVSVVYLTSGPLLINKDMTIDGGSGVTITRGSASKFRIFTVSNVTAVLSNLNITNGETTDQAGGIQNSGRLTLNNCNITGNESPQGNAIQNDEVIVLNNCNVSDNNGNQYGNGMTMYGDSTTANNTIFSNNGGSGIQTNNGSVVITLNNCLFVNNSENGVSFGGGAGSSVTNCTLANNTSKGIDIGSSAAKITIVNSIFAGNNYKDISHSSPDLGAGSTNNLVGSTNAGGLVNGVNGNRINVPALFLDNSDADGADNTWFTADDGFSLTACSQAINTGTSSGISGTDILGNARLGTADIGAYEYQSVSGLEAVASNVMVDFIDVCSGSTVTLTGSCEGSGGLTWYDVATDGTALGTGVSFTQNPTENSTYYAACYAGACEGPRTATEEVQILPNAADLENTVTLTTDYSADTIKLANDYINATNKIISPADVIYHSGKAVNLNPGFESQNGSVFLARADIVTCP
ncbi:Putative Ig domain-containing protein [Spirosomataceae bacterium TFI 002]|nr:Putative Ig domain-containing protein [Spirosomataceae bacterium TFI 002]